MDLCKRNDREECDNEKLKNSAYCFGCHKEIEETKNYVGPFNDYLYGNRIKERRVAGLLTEAHEVVAQENHKMVKLVEEIVARMAAMKVRDGSM